MSKTVILMGKSMPTKDVAEFLYAETRDKNYQAETGCAYAKFNSCKIAEPGTEWEELTLSQKMQAMSMSMFQMLGNGDDRGEPILIKTANTTKEVWCPFTQTRSPSKARMSSSVFTQR